MKWAGHMVRMKDERLPKRSETKKQEGWRKKESPQLRWEDCVKRDLKKAEEEEKWRGKANNRDQWNFFNRSSRTVEWQLDQPHPYKRETRGRTRAQASCSVCVYIAAVYCIRVCVRACALVVADFLVHVPIPLRCMRKYRHDARMWSLVTLVYCSCNCRIVFSLCDWTTLVCWNSFCCCRIRTCKKCIVIIISQLVLQYLDEYSYARAKQIQWYALKIHHRIALWVECTYAPSLVRDS